MSKRHDSLVDGLLLIDKPQGPSSFQIVRAVRKAVRTRKVGHGGTLDPMATGLLPVALGRATRLIDHIMGSTKVYVGEVTFGAQTNTDDAMGEVIATGRENVTEAEIREALPRFVGCISQQPPVFSALKVDGKRAYAEARKGNSVELKPREVQVHELDLVGVDPSGTKATIRVVCGKGTYIRAIARDLGLAMGTVAHLSALRRTAVGPWEVDDAMTPESLSAWSDHLIKPYAATAVFPLIEIEAEQASAVFHGHFTGMVGAPGWNRVAVRGTETLLSILECDQDGSPTKMRVFARKDLFLDR